jgi:cytochrome c peroxidase
MRRQTRLPRRASLAAALLLCWSGAYAAAPHDHPEPVVLAPGYAALEFEPPAAGSYQLPPLGSAADGEVIDTQGRQASLYSHLGDKFTVLSFIYTTCNDVNGCPLATYVMKGVQDTVLGDAALKDKVRLISFSFDPDNDTPEVLHDYGQHFKQAGFDWRFLTTRSAQELDPILDAYGQWVIRDYDQQGNYLGSMSHILRVFLIDQEKRIRNIYSTSFLHADTVANDLRTLAME